MNLLIEILLICIPLILLSRLLPEKFQILPIVAATGGFLGFHSPLSLIILTLTTLSGFYALRLMPSLVGATLTVIFQAVGIFLFFKLKLGADFGLSDQRIIPLGLSYYAFRQIHYAVEAYKQKLPRHSLFEYIQYMFFLPTILVGPINRFGEFNRDLKRRRWDAALFSVGFERILYGFFKIIVLGNYFFSKKMPAITQSLKDENLWLSTYLDAVNFFANAYVQFAGYSDVAIGLSALFGFRIIENFNWPFLAQNISDFWNRWHISLSDWCRDYVYYPFLGMTRNGQISIIVSMLVLAGWHEISWRYIIWGALHAVAINIWHRYNGSPIQKSLHNFIPLPHIWGIIINLNFVIFSFIIIKKDSFDELFETFKILFLIQ